MKVKISGLMAVAFVFGLAISGSPALAAPQGPWVRPPITLSGNGADALGYQIGVAPDGTATVVWSRSNGSHYIVQASTRPPGGTFSDPVDLSYSGAHAFQAQIAIGPDGNSTVVWRRNNGSYNIIQAATRPPGGSFGDPVDLSATLGNADGPQIATAPDGTTTAVWQRWDGSNDIVQASTRSPGGSFGAAIDLSAIGENARDAQIATAPDGTATVVWYRNNGPDTIIQAATRPLAGSFGVPVDLSAPGSGANSPQIAVAADGTAAVVWRRYNDSGLDKDWIIQAAIRPPGGSFGAPADLSAIGRDADNPQIATAPDGTVTAVWDRKTEVGNSENIQAATRPPGGSFGTPVDLSTAGIWPHIAVARDGTATVAFYQSNFIRATTRPPGGSFGTPVDLSAILGGDPYPPEIAVAPNGTATAVWHSHNGSNMVVRAISTGQPSDSGKPRLKVTRITPGRPKVKTGKTVALRVTARNAGNGTASNTRLCVTLTGAVKKALRPQGRTCQALGSLGAGKSRTKVFRLKATAKAKKGWSYQVKFKLMASGAKAATKAVKVNVK